MRLGGSACLWKGQGKAVSGGKEGCRCSIQQQQ
jgi:hypothetical protein